MIIPPPQADDKHRLAATADAELAVPRGSPALLQPIIDVHDDPPPTYTEHVSAPAFPIPVTNQPTTAATPSSESESTSSSPPTPTPTPTSLTTTLKQHLLNLKPTNYISIVRLNDHIKGVWLLNPTLSPPSYLLPPLTADEEREETRRNLNLSTLNGYIEAEVTLAAAAAPDLNDKERDKKKKKNAKRTTLYARSSNGGVKMKLHCSDDGQRPTTTTITTTRLPFYLDIFTSNGAVLIHLPRSFRGPLVIKTLNGAAKFSPEIQSRLTTFSDVNKTRKCFIGDIDQDDQDQDDDGSGGGKKWEGDEVVVEARNGAVRVLYDDEDKDRDRDRTERKSGFFGKLFGF